MSSHDGPVLLPSSSSSNNPPTNPNQPPVNKQQPQDESNNNNNNNKTLTSQPTSTSSTHPPTTTSTSTTTTTTTASTTSTRRRRRSTRVLDQDPIVAPGYGTAKDLVRLTQELDHTLPLAAVQAVMTSRGRGIRSKRLAPNDDDNNPTTAAAATPVSSAWADFMKQEGVLGGDDKKEEEDNSKKRKGTTEGDAAVAASTSTGTRSSTRKSRRSTTSKEDDDNKEETAVTTTSSGRSYALPTAWQTLPHGTKSSNKKKKNDDKEGWVLQAGTLDAAIVGRTKGGSGSSSKSKSSTAASAAPVYACPIPTRLVLPVPMVRVFTSCNAVHSFCQAANGTTYAWGRNECHQLGPLEGVDTTQQQPANVHHPTPLDLPTTLYQAACGKSHSIFLLTDNTLYGVGANKSGQCSVRSSQEVIGKLRKCSLDQEDVVWAQIACGEDFTMALSTEGHLYSCGSSQYGQLGNGETGEYFITANKLAFANATVLERRSVFCHAPTEKLHTNNETAKVVPIQNHDEILMQQVACGKHHTLVVEATDASGDDQRPRIFSFGCGDYGCLGHGIQKDEYYPRQVGLVAKLPLGSPSSSSSSSDRPFLSVAAGAHCSLLQTSTGHVYYWGKHRSVGEAVMRPQLVDVLAHNQHVVTHAAAGGQTVVCCTALAQTVAWGQGPHGELGLPTAKSSAKPTFVPALQEIPVWDLAAGYGHSLFVVPSTGPGVNDLPQVHVEDVQELVEQDQAKGAT